MRAKDIVNGLAIAGALIALVGVTLATNEALAAELDTIDTTAVAIHDAGDRALTDAAMANAEAAEQAVSALQPGKGPDLDFRLMRHNVLALTGGR